MNILVTGAGGFLGRNLLAHLNRRESLAITSFDAENSRDDLRAALKTADIVYHLAGVNRPRTDQEFEGGNAGLTGDLCALLSELGRAPLIVFSSSVQAALDNPYGVSKRHAEYRLREFAAESGAQVRIYRLKNVFGKWSRPDYNSAVATFCHNVARDLPIRISEPSRELELVYVDDVMEAFLGELTERVYDRHAGDCPGGIPSFRLTLGDLVGRIQSMHAMHANLLTPDFAVRFNRQLFATYLSYVPDAARRRQLKIQADGRGQLAEFLKSSHFGQIFVSRTRPGVTRGNHYHHSKAERFLVVEGRGLIRMRPIESSEVVEYRVRGEAFQVVDVPPGWTHSIENVGAGEMVTLFWTAEIFDPDRPDTYYLPVLLPSQAPEPIPAGLTG